EQWQQAQETFQEVLKLDGAIRFAIQGSDRAQQMLRLEKRMAYYLKQPEVLSTDSYLDKALQLISEAQAVTPRGTRLQEQLQQLLLLVTAARTPVAVVVDSDGRTEVSIYRVGKLGRFTRRELQLRPGTYTVVGVRDGFQDVHRQVPVMAGRGPVRISITCTDKI
ncbi:MAG: hypothetical protein GY868_09790, partial [Deltaproteobacteria bacterium]|nr:hypothetical protein [Deltaproteobacteria bacterium]